MEDTKYWLISEPKTSLDSLQTLKNALKKASAEAFEFRVPPLRVGTYDSLIALSDELYKVDSMLEAITKRTARQLFDLLGSTDHGVLSVNGTHVSRHFSWDEAKYSLRNSLQELTETIVEQAAKIDEDLRKRAQDYSQLASAESVAAKKNAGSLVQRNLNEYVDTAKMIDTEHLITLLVVVATSVLKDWFRSYEALSEFVVPNSSDELLSENDFSLVTVVIFKRDVDKFKQECGKRRFTVREFKPEDAQATAKQHEKLIQELDLAKKTLVRWCKTWFEEAFIAWFHLKAIRVFVESVLRYGLPANYSFLLVQPHPKGEKKARDVLHALYAHLSSEQLYADKGEEEVPGVVSEKFYPYVSLDINFDMR